MLLRVWFSDIYFFFLYIDDLLYLCITGEFTIFADDTSKCESVTVIELNLRHPVLKVVVDN